MRMRVLVGCILCLALVLPTVAFAQAPATKAEPGQGQTQTTVVNVDQNKKDKDEKYDYLAIYVGGPFGGNLYSSTSPTAAVQRGARAFGGAIGFWGPGAVSGELDFCYYPSFFGDANSAVPGGPNAPSQLGSNNVMTFVGNFLVHPTFHFGSSGRIRPYALVGGGLMRSTIKEFTIYGSDTRNRGVVDVGGGIMIYPVQAIGFRADARYNMAVGAEPTDPNGWGWIQGWNWWRWSAAVLITF